MALTKLSKYTSYEVSFVPYGANNKKKFLVTKESNGETTMDKLVLEQILKEGLKDEEAVDKVVKNLDLDENGQAAFKAVMKIVGAKGANLDRDQLMKALKGMGVKKEGDDDEEKKKLEAAKKEDEDESSRPPNDVTGGDDKADEEGKVNKELNKGGGNMVPILKEDGSWDLSGVDEKLRPALEVVCKSNQQMAKSLVERRDENKTLADKLKASEDSRVLKEFVEKAKEMGALGAKADEVGLILKTAYDVSAEHGSSVEKVMKEANAKIVEGDLFKEQGTTGTGIHGADAWAKIEKSADMICEKDPLITRADAISRVLKVHPELYAEYQEEKRRAN